MQMYKDIKKNNRNYNTILSIEYYSNYTGLEILLLILIIFNY